LNQRFMVAKSLQELTNKLHTILGHVYWMNERHIHPIVSSRQTYKRYFYTRPTYSKPHPNFHSQPEAPFQGYEFVPPI
jgi:hypothetical protein